MEKITTTICKTVIGVAVILAWTYIFISLVIIGPGIWGVLWMLFTTICLIVWISKTIKTKKYKSLYNTVNELEKRIADLEKEQMVNRVLQESEGKKKD